MNDIKELQQMQSLPLEIKIMKTQARIREWVQHFGLEDVYVSFSGGKDSTVLLDIARKVYPKIEAVFIDTGLEYPEIREFVKTFDNVVWLHPKMNFYQVVKKYGYPVISKEISESIAEAKDEIKRGENKTIRAQQLLGILKNKDGQRSAYCKEKYLPLCFADFNISSQCCSVMKKRVAHSYKKYPITAQTAEESRLRTSQWVKNGCNGFNMKRPISNPMSFWKEQDVLEYIKRFNLPIASVYGSVVESGVDDGQMTLADFGCNCGNCELKTSGVARTGCVFCGYGVHLEKEPTRFQRLKETHPRLYEYCMGGGEYIDGVWQPNKKGLGMKHIFDECNKIYGDGFIKYE